jgi:hypothetical protein
VARVRLVPVVALLLALVVVPSAAPASSAVGNQRVLVILGTSSAQPYSVGRVQEVTRETADFYRTSSFGQLNLDFDITPWLHAFTADPGCGFTSQNSFDALMQPARLAAQRAGYEPGKYPRLVYVLADSRCAFFGTTWGQEVTLTREPTLELLLHELGHSFGLGHAGASSCVNGCSVIEPGDPYSPMGTGDKLLDFTACEKVVLGWLPEQPKVTQDGRYTLVPSGRAGPGRHALVIDTEIGEWWIEYRAKPFRGLLVHFVDVLHPTPVFAIGPILMTNPTHHHRNWIASGETYRVDTFTVKLLSAGTPQAQVRIHFVGG